LSDAPQPAPHLARQAAESFGSDPERYDRTRPRYPQALADRIVAASPGPDVLDVGVGTGISARPFTRAGCRVLGVEVDARMAEFARGCGIDVEVAKFEEWESAGRTFDTVVSGQSWHWVDPLAGAAKARTVLRPGGRLAAFWNVFSPPAALSEEMAAVYRRVLPDSPFSVNRVMPGLEAYSAIFDRTADGIRSTAGFGEPEQWQFDWERRYTRDEWLEQVPTFGGHSQFPPDVLDELLAGVGAAIDALGGSFVMGYAAVAVTAAVSTPA
jgi:SAM-dependent methyltransferase